RLSLEKALELSKVRAGGHLCLLAMTCQQLGDKDKALACYERAAAATKAALTRTELRRLDAEAAEMLGINKTTVRDQEARTRPSPRPPPFPAGALRAAGGVLPLGSPPAGPDGPGRWVCAPG